MECINRNGGDHTEIFDKPKVSVVADVHKKAITFNIAVSVAENLYT